jgi:hypothetical protein
MGKAEAGGLDGLSLFLMAAALACLEIGHPFLNLVIATQFRSR